MSMTQVDSGAGGGARNTRGRTPVWGPRLSGEEIDLTVSEITMTLSEAKHDSTTLTCVSSTLETTDGMLDMPFSFYFGVPPHTELFQGYVTDLTDEKASQGSLSFTLTILGATKMMFKGQPRFWANKSATTAASQLANANLLGFGGHPHTFLWSALAQTEESDWEMLNKLTRRIGWSVFSRYGVVLAYNPNQWYREMATYTRLVTNNTDLGSDDRNLIEFGATEFSSVSKENLGSNIGYFNGTDVSMMTQPGEFKGYIQDTDAVLQSQPEAEAYMEGVEVRLDSWSQNAIARLWGDADIFPLMCVDVLTVRNTYQYAKYDGKWLVRAVSHKADNQSFQTVLYLTRPDPDEFPPMPTSYHPFWEEEPTPRPRPYLTLYEDQWVSSWNTPSSGA